METTIYKIELADNFAVIFKMERNGMILDSEEVSTSKALDFISRKGLSMMEYDGEIKCYW